MVDRVRLEDFTGTQSGQFSELTETDVELADLREKYEELQQRCDGLEAENLYLRIAANFTDSKRREILAMLRTFTQQLEKREVTHVVD